MSLRIQRFPNEPIILCQVIGSLNAAVQRTQMLEEVAKLKHEMGCPVYRIIDLSDARFDFGQVALGMADERDQEGGMNDPDVSTLMVSTHEVMKLAVKSVQGQAQYGSVKTALFASVDEALVHARAEIARK